MDVFQVGDLVKLKFTVDIEYLEPDYNDHFLLVTMVIPEQDRIIVKKASGWKTSFTKSQLVRVNIPTEVA